MGRSSALTVVVLAILVGSPAATGADPMPPEKVVLIVHGGAGALPREILTKDREGLYRADLELALKAGHAVLKEGGASVDAVEAAIRVLEDSPRFNAGKGAVFTHEGRNELDSSIMDGRTGKAGAVAGVTVVKNPIGAARAVMDQSRHVLLAGPGADAFAREKGLPLVDPSYFRTEERWQELQEALEKERTRAGLVPAARPYLGTVGAVALDRAGHLAAGTSTGGMTNKRFGRVGDSPIIGAGTYAEDGVVGVSATGHGEYFLRHVVAYDIAARLKYQKVGLREATNAVIHGVLNRDAGEGGLIALEPSGRWSAPYNSDGMYRGVIAEDGTLATAIYEQEGFGQRD